MQRKTKIIIAVTAALAVITLGSGTVLEMHAANDVSSVSQTTAPSTVTADSSKLTADSTSGTKQDYTVKYTDKSTGNQSATLQKKTYGSTSSAENQVDYVGTNTEGVTVKLNGSTTAVVQGVMGHTYVHWNKGDWSVTAVASNADETGTPTQFAKQVNKQITASSLPKSADTGAITVYSGTEKDEANSVSWQNGKQLYTVSGKTAAGTVKLAQNTD
ncbi:hypothetical protein [Levilactobacillus sp. N40-8-2]|uniref:hypothetical protein n=1 Tax=Levilactobacillus muriae TaxID=3238987 RepID=UPI0038B3D84A